jgi:hypothetical protein
MGTMHRRRYFAAPKNKYAYNAQDPVTPQTRTRPPELETEPPTNKLYQIGTF